jgi:integrase
MPVLLPVLKNTGMKYNCTFYLDKEKNGYSPINVCITYAGNRLRYYIGYRINKDNIPDEQGEKKNSFQKVKQNSIGLEGKTKVKYNAINSRIDTIKVTINKIFEPAMSEPHKKYIIDQLDEACLKVKSKKDVETFWQTFDRYVEVSDVAPLSRKQMKSTGSHFKAFEASKRLTLTFDAINGETITAFEKWLKDGTRGGNHVSNTLKRMKRFFIWAIKDQKQRNVEATIKNPFSDYVISPEVYGTPIILEKNERDILYNLAIENDRLKKVRDIFVFQCYCGARISDLLNLKTTNIQNGVLRFTPQKTSKKSMTEVEVPLNQKAIDILKRYDNADGYLLPHLSDVEINRSLKPLFREAKLNRPVQHLNPKTGNIEYLPLDEVATTHLARRTFAGLMYKAGAKNEVIASMTGHSEKSTSFARYRKVDLDQKKKATKKL